MGVKVGRLPAVFLPDREQDVGGRFVHEQRPYVFGQRVDRHERPTGRIVLPRQRLQPQLQREGPVAQDVVRLTRDEPPFYEVDESLLVLAAREIVAPTPSLERLPVQILHADVESDPHAALGRRIAVGVVVTRGEGILVVVPLAAHGQEERDHAPALAADALGVDVGLPPPAEARELRRFGAVPEALEVVDVDSERRRFSDGERRLSHVDVDDRVLMAVHDDYCDCGDR
mmetsp:Transcript_5560/g.12174  ORF Transcript_5560/g.12174 Transcript_5560/m.12174 type:complete len:229 (+) Transcript_5560:1095-1781(+)